MSWLAIVFWVLTHIPDFISVIQQIIKLIGGMPHPQSESVRSNISDAIKSGDVDSVKEKLMAHAGAIAGPSTIVSI